MRGGQVALRKESVDRNLVNVARAADRVLVALRKESVDRNYGAVVTFQHSAGRSPQGERG